jgi:hypothetical protein
MGRQHRRQRIRAVYYFRGGPALGHGQEVQIVIAEHGQRGLSEPLHEAQHLERAGSAVDQVPGQPQASIRRIETNAVQEGPQLIITTLDITDGVGEHDG